MGMPASVYASSLRRAYRPLPWLLGLLPLLAVVYLFTTPLFWIAPLLVLGLGLMVVIFMRPALAYYAVITLIPFGAYRATADGVKLDWLLAGAALLVVGLQSLARRRLPQDLKNPLWLWWLGLLMVFIASLYISPWPETVVHNIRNLLVAGMFMGLTMALVDCRAYLSYLPEVLIASISTGSAAAVLGFIFHLELFEDAGSFARGTGLTADPNNLALFVIFVTPLLADRLVHARGGLRLYYLVALLINIAALITTYSRGGLLGFVLCLLLLGWNYRSHFRPRRLGIGLAVAMLSGVILAASVPASYWERQMSLAKGTDFALQRRSSYLVVGWQAFKESPLLGHGAGTFRDIYGESAMGAAFAREGKTRRRFAHNSYLEMLVGTGSLGFILYAGMLGYAWLSLRRASRAWKNRGDSRLAQLTTGYLISLTITILYLAIFSEPLHKYLLLLLALSQLAVRHAASPRTAEPAGPC